MTSAIFSEQNQANRASASGWKAIVAAFLVGGLLVWAAEGRTADHLQFAICLLTSLAWMFARTDASVVALVGATGVACVSLLDPSTVAAPLAHLGDDTTVLIIAAFILAKAIERSGLAGVLADHLIGKRTGASYARLGAGVFATTFLIPSTAARASVLVPLVDRAKARTADPRRRRAMALMAPLTVVLGAFASPVAAGANLLAIQMLAAHTGASLSFATWIELALPFALVMVASAALAAWFSFRGPNVTGSQPVASTTTAAHVEAANAGRGRLIAILVIVVVLWSTTAWHPLEPMLIAVVAAVLVTLPKFGVLTLKEGLNSVDWSLIVLLTAATYIGDALSHNALLDAAVGHAEAFTASLDHGLAVPLVISVVAIVAMLSHILVTSRSARAALLLPPALAIGTATGADPTVIALTIASATGFCILTPVGSKALVIFAGSDPDDFSRATLVRAGLLLLPVQFALTLLFALLVWPFLLGNH